MLCIALSKPTSLLTGVIVKLFMTISAVPCGARNFVRRVTGSLEEAPQKLNPTKCRVRAKKESRSRFANLRKGVLKSRLVSPESGQCAPRADLSPLPSSSNTFIFSIRE
jgi:hypothetical protein